MENIDILIERKICYDLPNFHPIKIDRDFLVKSGINYPISDKVDLELQAGTQWFTDLYQNRALTPHYEFSVLKTDTEEELEIHNYTGICPKNVLEVTPSVGSCAVACQYCLVTDGGSPENLVAVRHKAS